MPSILSSIRVTDAKDSKTTVAVGMSVLPLLPGIDGLVRL